MTAINIYRNGLLVLLPIYIMWILATSEPADITVYMIGDSTMSAYKADVLPLTGWGMPFSLFFDASVTVENHAKSGRSTRTFLEEGHWEPIVNKLVDGDYVLIQFAHNDEVKTKKSYTTEDEFTANLARYVTETRNKGARPILLTPVARRVFDEAGKLIDTHRVYSELVRIVARLEGVPLIDMDRKSQKLLSDFGPEGSKFLFNHLESSQNPNYPEGKKDDSHFNEYGARRMAELALEGIRELNLDLAKRIVKR